jgi:Ran GTPase-activating protein (RanGAP) involved in mRNA processing and transport
MDIIFHVFFLSKKNGMILKILFLWFCIQVVVLCRLNNELNSYVFQYFTNAELEKASRSNNTLDYIFNHPVNCLKVFAAILHDPNYEITWQKDMITLYWDKKFINQTISPCLVHDLSRRVKVVFRNVTEWIEYERQYQNWIDIELNLMSKKIRDEDVELIADAVIKRKRLTNLNLYCTTLTLKGVKLLASALPGSSIRILDLSYNFLTEESIKVISQSILTGNSRLRTLHLGGNSFGTEGLVSLLDVLRNKNTNLKHLDLSGCNLGDVGMDLLSSLRSESFIKILDLSRNNITNRGAYFIARIIENSLNLEKLVLRYNYISDAGVVDISNALLTNNRLETLYLGYNLFGYAGAKAVIYQLGYKNNSLVNLELSGNLLSNDGGELLGYELKGNTKLRSLMLDNTKIGNTGLIMLARVLKYTKITTLELRNNHIGRRGIKVLAMELPNTEVSHLDLGENYFGTEGAIALSKSLDKITLLDLRRCAIKNEGMRAISEALINSRLVTLNVEYNSINYKGAVHLSEAFMSGKTHLITLEMGGNSIGDIGLELLAKAIQTSENSLAVLNMRCNFVGNHGAVKISQTIRGIASKKKSIVGHLRCMYENMFYKFHSCDSYESVGTKSRLTYLNLRRNQIGLKGLQAIYAAFEKCKIDV